MYLWNPNLTNRLFFCLQKMTFSGKVQIPDKSASVEDTLRLRALMKTSVSQRSSASSYQNSNYVTIVLNIIHGSVSVATWGAFCAMLCPVWGRGGQIARSPLVTWCPERRRWPPACMPVSLTASQIRKTLTTEGFLLCASYTKCNWKRK